MRSYVAVLCVCACGVSLRAADLVPFGHEWSYLHPVTGLAGDPSNTDPDFVTTWFLPDYDTTSPLAWSEPAPAPFAYGEADENGNPNVFHINAFTPGDPNFIREVGTFLPQPEGERYATYFRTTFTNSADSNEIGIELLAEDGAKVYLDGEELVSWNCCEIADPGTPADYVELSLGVGYEDGYVVGRVLVGESIPAGEHTLAVGVHQAAVDSSDMGFSMRLIEGYLQDTFIDRFQDWAYFTGIEEPSNGTLDWTKPDFDDSTWPVGTEGFGYETDPNSQADLLFGTPLPEMETEYTSLYVRRSFTIDEDPSSYDTLYFEADYDDGFVAYINGVEVLATVIDPDDDPTTGIPFDTLGNDVGAAAESTNGSGFGGVTFSIVLDDFPGLLNEGDNNVLAIHGINRFPSSDYVLAQLGLIGSGERGKSTVLRGDFDGSGQLDVADVDLLSTAIQQGDLSSEFDLDNSGEVDVADLNVWIEQVRGTYLGDANLDG
ncbi:MAG: hypothetical protein KDB27_08140, partial [Planctomycetales bacterium]|nr:hypothetical protein [Planctomycetales bacterium]